MKKILYIIPIVVFAMVGLTEDAKAQNGQTGNASNAITQGATNAVVGSALTNTSTGSDNTAGGGTTAGVTVTPTAPVPVAPVVVGGSVTPLRIPAPSFPRIPTLTITKTLQLIQIGGFSFFVTRIISVSIL